MITPKRKAYSSTPRFVATTLTDPTGISQLPPVDRLESSHMFEAVEFDTKHTLPIKDLRSSERLEEGHLASLSPANWAVLRVLVAVVGRELRRIAFQLAAGTARTRSGRTGKVQGSRMVDYLIQHGQKQSTAAGRIADLEGLLARRGAVVDRWVAQTRTADCGKLVVVVVAAYCT